MSPSEEYLAQQRAQERAAMVRQVVSHRGQEPAKSWTWQPVALWGVAVGCSIALGFVFLSGAVTI